MILAPGQPAPTVTDHHWSSVTLPATFLIPIAGFPALPSTVPRGLTAPLPIAEWSSTKSDQLTPAWTSSNFTTPLPPLSRSGAGFLPTPRVFTAHTNSPRQLLVGSAILSSGRANFMLRPDKPYHQLCGSRGIQSNHCKEQLLTDYPPEISSRLMDTMAFPNLMIASK